MKKLYKLENVEEKTENKIEIDDVVDKYLNAYLSFSDGFMEDYYWKWHKDLPKLGICENYHIQEFINRLELEHPNRIANLGTYIGHLMHLSYTEKKIDLFELRINSIVENFCQRIHGNEDNGLNITIDGNLGICGMYDANTINKITVNGNVDNLFCWTAKNINEVIINGTASESLFAGAYNIKQAYVQQAQGRGFLHNANHVNIVIEKISGQIIPDIAPEHCHIITHDELTYQKLISASYARKNNIVLL